MIMEAEKSWDQQSASWRPRKTSGIVSVWLQRPEKQENWWCKFQSKGRGRLINVPAQQTDTEGSKKEQIPPSFAFFFFLFYSFWRLWKTGWVPLTLGRAIYLTESTDSKANFIQKYSYRCTPKQYLTWVLLVLFSWHINLTITQGLADCFCKGPDRKYFRFCGPHIVPPTLIPFNYLKMLKPFFSPRMYKNRL